MRSAILSTIVLDVALFSSSALATRLLAVEVVQSCKTICLPIVELTKVCAIHQPQAAVVGVAVPVQPVAIAVPVQPVGIAVPVGVPVGVQVGGHPGSQSSNDYDSYDRNKGGRHDNPARYRYRRSGGVLERDDAHIQPRTFGKCHGGRCAQPPQQQLDAQCVCSNRSFNVPSVAALCASCLRQGGVAIGNAMDQIMGQCAFTSTVFVESATTLVQHVTVTVTQVLGNSLTQTVVVPVTTELTETKTETRTRGFTPLAPFVPLVTPQASVAQSFNPILPITATFSTTRTLGGGGFSRPSAVTAVSQFSQVTPFFQSPSRSPSPTFLFQTTNSASKREVSSLLALFVAVLGLL